MKMCEVTAVEPLQVEHLQDRCSTYPGVQMTQVFNLPRCSTDTGVQMTQVFNLPKCSTDTGVQMTQVFN